MDSHLELAWDRLSLGQLRRAAPTLGWFARLAGRRLLGRRLGCSPYPGRLLDRGIVLPDGKVVAGFRRAVEGFAAEHPDELHARIEWYRFSSGGPEEQGASFLSADGLVGTMVAWQEGAGAELVVSCTSVLPDGRKLVTFGHRSFIEHPPTWAVAVRGPSPRDVLSGHRGRVACEPVVAIPPARVTPLVVELNNERIDHNVRQGYLVPASDGPAGGRPLH